MKQAIVAIEDQRFYTNHGVDLRGIARALVAGLLSRRRRQGASTITQQFVKNALAAQSDRTVFQKLREAALAYHLTRKWTKEKILTEYLNAIYFGNGAYGIESAARDVLRKQPDHAAAAARAANLCAAAASPPEAALLAGIVPVADGLRPDRAPAARRSAAQHGAAATCSSRATSRRASTTTDLQDPLPTQTDLTPPHGEDPVALLHHLGRASRSSTSFGPLQAFSGGLQITTTLDLDLQQAAENAIREAATRSGPSASLVAIDNKTGEVRAMVGGRDYATSPSTSRRRGSASPARRSSRSCWPRRSRRASRPARVWIVARSSFIVPAQRREKLRRSTTTRASTRARRRSRARRRTPTTPSSRRSASGRDEEDRARSPSGWASARRSRRTTR